MSNPMSDCLVRPFNILSSLLTEQSRLLCGSYDFLQSYKIIFGTTESEEEEIKTTVPPALESQKYESDSSDSEEEKEEFVQSPKPTSNLKLNLTPSTQNSHFMFTPKRSKSNLEIERIAKYNYLNYCTDSDSDSDSDLETEANTESKSDSEFEVEYTKQHSSSSEDLSILANSVASIEKPDFGTQVDTSLDSDIATFDAYNLVYANMDKKYMLNDGCNSESEDSGSDFTDSGSDFTESESDFDSEKEDEKEKETKPDFETQALDAYNWSNLLLEIENYKNKENKKNKENIVKIYDVADNTLVDHLNNQRKMKKITKFD